MRRNVLVLFLAPSFPSFCCSSSICRHKMPALWTVARLLAILPVVVAVVPNISTTTFTNPILPGFHPDPSCIHVPDDDGNSNSPGTFYCVSSSFSAFPGIPIHASRDLQNWSLVGHVLNRRSQLPALVATNRSTSGIWAPTLRYHGGTFYVTTSMSPPIFFFLFVFLDTTNLQPSFMMNGHRLMPRGGIM